MFCHRRHRHGRRRTGPYRSEEDRVLLGVCAGLAEHFELPTWAMRLFFIVGTAFFFPFPVIAYFILAMIMKPQRRRVAPPSEEEEFWSNFESSRGAALERVRATFDRLERRLQRMESIVTRPGFDWEDEFRNL